jgi:predicted nucleic-acid-binding Zn-ribbon protein
MSTAHIVCRKCGFKIGTPFECWCDAPAHFIVTCPRCGYRGVYSYADIVVANKERCVEKCRELVGLRERLYTAVGLPLLADAVSTVLVNIVQMLLGAEQKEEDK